MTTVLIRTSTIRILNSYGIVGRDLEAGWSDDVGLHLWTTLALCKNQLGQIRQSEARGALDMQIDRSQDPQDWQASDRGRTAENSLEHKGNIYQDFSQQRLESSVGLVMRSKSIRIRCLISQHTQR